MVEDIDTLVYVAIVFSLARTFAKLEHTLGTMLALLLRDIPNNRKSKIGIATLNLLIPNYLYLLLQVSKLFLIALKLLES